MERNTFNPLSQSYITSLLSTGVDLLKADYSAREWRRWEERQQRKRPNTKAPSHKGFGTR